MFLSTAGNWIIRTGLSYAVTMNTGMTRGYRREKILALPLDEDGKELHLEIISKALALGYRISEIPAILEWKDHKLANPNKAKRKSSSKIRPIIGSHLLFSVIAAPFRYLYVLAFIGVMAGLGFVGAAFYRLFVGEVAIYFALTGFSLLLIALLLAALALLSQQGRILQAESWRVRSELRQKDLGKTG